jgi:hypothetical protein
MHGTSLEQTVPEAESRFEVARNWRRLGRGATASGRGDFSWDNDSVSERDGCDGCESGGLDPRPDSRGSLC